MFIGRNTILQSLQYFDTHKFDSIKNAEKVLLRYRLYSEPVVCCHYQVYCFLLNKMKRIFSGSQYGHVWNHAMSCTRVLQFAIDSMVNVIDRAGMSP